MHKFAQNSQKTLYDPKLYIHPNEFIVKVTLNLSLSRCMFFAHCSSNFHPILMKFDNR